MYVSIVEVNRKETERKEIIDNNVQEREKRLSDNACFEVSSFTASILSHVSPKIYFWSL